MRNMGPYGPSNKQTMEKLKDWAKEKKLFHSTILLGIPQDNPETTAPENCRYDACIVIPENYLLDDSINEGELQGGNYVVFKMNHTAEDIQKAWDEWLPALQKSGYQIANKPILERYTSELVNNHTCDICIPVKIP
ncbi:DNA gyrase inhibitor [Virgibacillus soli]|nr:DNA gyrase inhibitor [Virgibacillus soli]